MYHIVTSFKVEAYAAVLITITDAAFEWKFVGAVTGIAVGLCVIILVVVIVACYCNCSWYVMMCTKIIKLLFTRIYVYLYQVFFPEINTCISNA